MILIVALNVIFWGGAVGAGMLIDRARTRRGQVPLGPAQPGTYFDITP